MTQGKKGGRAMTHTGELIASTRKAKNLSEEGLIRAAGYAEMDKGACATAS